MGDMGDMFREWDADKKAKKKSNLEYSTAKLKQLGVDFESKNGGVHLVITVNAEIIDFWPSTGKFKNRKETFYRRGLNQLLMHLAKLD